MNTAELNPTVPQEVIDQQFADITANLNMAPAFNIPAESLNLSDKGFKAAAEMGNTAVNNEVSIEGGADYFKSADELAAIARKSQALYNQASGVDAARAAYEMSRVGTGDGDSEEDDK